MELEKAKIEMSVRLKERGNEVGKLQEEYKLIVKEKTDIHHTLTQLQQKLTQSEQDLAMYQEKEATLIMQMEEIESELAETQKKTSQTNKEKNNLEEELEKKNLVLIIQRSKIKKWARTYRF